MKPCPKCQTKNQDSNNFCKKCGSKLSGSSFEDKKEKVLGEKKRKPYWVLISLAVLAILLAGASYWIIDGNTGSTGSNSKVSTQPKLNEKVDYAGQRIAMTDVQARWRKETSPSPSTW